MTKKRENTPPVGGVFFSAFAAFLPIRSNAA
jgi:hypothetical protein